MFKEIITRDEMTDLPLRWFEGDIYVVDSFDLADNVAEYLSMQPIIGFDTETKPSFKKGVTNSVALLQLSTDNEAFLIRVNQLGLPNSIKRLLSNPRIVKTGVAIRDDIKGLQSLSRFQPKGFIELQDVAKQEGIKNFSLKKLAAIVLGIRISKSQQLSNWEAVELTDAQKSYAATDAWASLQIYQHLLNS